MLERGLSKAEVARELGISRRTVYHWIGTGQRDRELDEASARYGPHPPVARKIDAFRGIIDARLSEFPSLTATRLFAEIRAAGYVGGYTQVKVCVRQVRPAPPADPIVRFETPPGRQVQADFAEWLDITDVRNPKKRSELGALEAIFTGGHLLLQHLYFARTAARFALGYGERMVLGMLSRFEP